MANGESGATPGSGTWSSLRFAGPRLGWLGALLAALGIGSGSVEGRAQNYHHAASNLAFSIPDGGGLGTFVQHEVTGVAGQITEVRVSVDISGTWGGDLYAFLSKGDGHAVLLNRVGKTDADPIGYGVAGFQVRFVETAAKGDIHRFRETPMGVTPPALSSPLTGDWAPDGRDVDPDLVFASDARTATLRAFNGMSPNGTWTLFVADMAAGSVHTLNGWALSLTTTAPAPSVRARRVFYNQSGFDGNNAEANSSDDAAIAPDKVALLPGGTAGFTNYTSYSRGLNGILVDIQGLAGNPTASDFSFRVGNSANLSTWTPGPAPEGISVRRGAGVGGSDRLTLVWGTNAVKGRWLEVGVLATPSTGLPSPDVFYFGNAIGESGNAPGTNALVNATDEIRARANSRSLLNPALLDNIFDYNRDRQVNATDQILARANITSPLTALRLISFSAGSAAALASDGVIQPEVGQEIQPGLSVGRREDGRLLIRSGEGQGAGIVLEMSRNSTDGPWQVVPVGAANALGLERSAEGWVVEVPTEAGAVFFRVRQPILNEAASSGP
jgi:subtilisin-like proprotein convertase family protein